MRFKLLFFSIVLCKLISAQVYSGLPFNFSHGLTIDSLFVADSGALSDIDLKISMSSTSYIRLLRLVLISPSETPITLFDGILDGTTLYQTIFDDSANTVITDGSPPYIGRYRPIESFSPIIGELITGYWQLMVYTEANISGSVTSWRLNLSTENSFSDTLPFYDQGFVALPFSFSTGLTIDSLFVADSGALSDIDLKISMSSTSYIRLLRLVLISPSETPITLFDGILDGTTLYQTIFDDSANTVITDGSPPYIGRYRPIESFSPIIGELITGYWQLMVYTEANISGSVTSWEILMNTDDETSIASTISTVPQDIWLCQNFPNPFNPSTTIRFGLPEATNALLYIYNVKGHVVQTVVLNSQAANWHQYLWNGKDGFGRPVPAGIYFARLATGPFSKTIKMLYLK